MLRNQYQLISEAVDEGFDRGVDLFVEQLEEDLHKSEVLKEYGEDAVVGGMMENAGVNVDWEDVIEE